MLSRSVSHILDSMGYSEWIIQTRREAYNLFENELNMNCEGINYVVSGSRREGLCGLYENDIDILVYLPGIVAVHQRGAVNVPYDIDIEGNWEVETKLCSPGYCLLLLNGTPEELDELVRPCFCALESDKICLSSERFLRMVHTHARGTSADVIVRSLAGPSIPFNIEGLIDIDSVVSVTCHCPAQLDDWFKRPRRYDWPSPALLQDVVSTPGNITAVGCKEDVFGKMEWRFCFNQAEIKLVESLNTTQNKIYVVLKMVLKDFLKPANKEVTSYTMKNIVFWLCESHPVSAFSPDMLLYWVGKALHVLKGSIHCGYLPYYMLPARNLHQGKFCEATKETMKNKLSSFLRAEPSSSIQLCKRVSFGISLLHEGTLEEWSWRYYLIDLASLPESMRIGHVRSKLEILRLNGIDDPILEVIGHNLVDVTNESIDENEQQEKMLLRWAGFVNIDNAEGLVHHIKYNCHDNGGLPIPRVVPL